MLAAVMPALNRSQPAWLSGRMDRMVRVLKLRCSADWKLLVKPLVHIMWNQMCGRFELGVQGKRPTLYCLWNPLMGFFKPNTWGRQAAQSAEVHAPGVAPPDTVHSCSVSAGQELSCVVRAWTQT